MKSMNRNRPSAKEELTIITFDSVHTLIKSFFENISVEQWQQLRNGTPSVATKLILADLLLDLIHFVSRAILKHLEGTNVKVTEDLVVSSLAHTIPEIAAAILNVTTCTANLNSEPLMRSIGEEVMANIRSKISAGLDPLEPEESSYIVHPLKLNLLIERIVELFKALMSKVRGMCTSHLFGQRGQTISEDESDLIGVTPAKAESVRSLQTPVRAGSPANLSDLTGGTPVRAENPEDLPEGSEENLKRAAPEVVQDILQTTVDQLTKSLTYSLSDTEQKLLEDDISLDQKELVGEIFGNVCSEGQLFEELKLEPSPLRQRLEAFFTKAFAKTSLCRIWKELRSKYRCVCKVENAVSLKSVLSCVDALLSQGEAENGVFSELKNSSSAKDLAISKSLSDLLYTSLTEMPLPEVERLDTQPDMVLISSQSLVAVYKEGQNKVCRFLVLMKWWLSIKVGALINRTTSALKVFDERVSQEKPETETIGQGLVTDKNCVQPPQTSDTESIKERLVSDEKSIVPARMSDQPAGITDEEFVQPARSSDTKSVRPARSSDTNSVHAARSSDTKSVHAARSSDTTSVHPARLSDTKSVRPVRTSVTKSFHPAQMTVEESVQSAQTSDTESVHPARTSDTKSVHPARSSDTKSVQSARMTVEESVQSVRSSDTKSVRPARTSDTKSVQPARPSDIKSVRPARTSDTKSVQPARTSDTKSVHPARSSDTKSVQSARTSDTESVLPARTSDTKSVQPARSSDTKSVQPARSSDTKSVQSARTSDTESVHPARTSDTKSFHPARLSDTKSVQPSRTSDTKSVHPARLSDTKSVQSARMTVEESVQSVRSSDTESVHPARTLDAGSILLSQIIEERLASYVESVTVDSMSEKKTFVMMLVGKIVSRLYRKTKVTWTIVDIMDIIRNLSEGIWAQIKDEDFLITPEKSRKIAKAVVKSLKAKWGSVEVVLVQTVVRDPAIETDIVSALRCHLKKTKRRSAIRRIVKAITKPFRSTSRHEGRAG